MNRKRNVSYIKPEDPEFLKVFKKQAGYDDQNHKFDDLQNAEEDFVDDEDSEQPQIVVLKDGDLTAEEAELEKKRLEKLEAETKADLTQKIIFKAKQKTSGLPTDKRKLKHDKEAKSNVKKSRPILSFDEDVSDEEKSS